MIDMSALGSVLALTTGRQSWRESNMWTDISHNSRNQCRNKNLILSRHGLIIYSKLNTKHIQLELIIESIFIFLIMAIVVFHVEVVKGYWSGCGRVAKEITLLQKKLFFFLFFLKIFSVILGISLEYSTLRMVKELVIFFEVRLGWWYLFPKRKIVFFRFLLC